MIRNRSQPSNNCSFTGSVIAVLLAVGAAASSVSASTVTWLTDGRYYAQGVVSYPTSYGQANGYHTGWGTVTPISSPYHFGSIVSLFDPGSFGHSTIDTATDTVTARGDGMVGNQLHVGNIWEDYQYYVDVFDTTFSLSDPTPFTLTRNTRSTASVPVSLFGPGGQTITLVGTPVQTISGTLDAGTWELKAVSDPSALLWPGAVGGANFYDFTFNITATPEPVVLAPVILTIGVCFTRRRRRPFMVRGEVE
jgi:hypothetical protein